MRTGVIGLGGMGAPMARNLQRAGLLETVWNANPEIQTRTVDMHVQRLRTKLVPSADRS